MERTFNIIQISLKATVVICFFPLWGCLAALGVFAPIVTMIEGDFDEWKSNWLDMDGAIFFGGCVVFGSIWVWMFCR